MFMKILQRMPYLIAAEIQDKDHTKLPRCMHMHDDRVEILYVRKGSGKYIINNKTYTIIAGDILIFEANVLHDESADKDCDVEIISCSVGGVQLQGFAPHKILQNSEPVLKTALYGEEVEHLLNRIYLMRNNPHLYTKELMEHYLATLILLIHKASSDVVEHLPKQLFDIGISVKDYIDKHYQEDIDIISISKVKKISESYISRTFKKVTNQSVMQYIIRRRIGEAQSWLLMSDLSVTDIATKVGYNSVSNFHSTFKRIVGMSPQAYRHYWQAKK